MNVDQRVTLAGLQSWLGDRVAGYLDVAPEQVDHDSPLADIGLDSVYALTLCGDLEDAFGITVEPTLAWDHPTIAALARGILDEVNAARAA
jgi:acyl carrier protein